MVEEVEGVQRVQGVSKSIEGLHSKGYVPIVVKGLMGVYKI